MPFGRSRARGIVVSLDESAAGRGQGPAGRRGRSARCRRRSSSWPSGSPTTTARRRPARSRWSRRRRRSAARSRRRRPSGRSSSTTRRRPSSRAPQIAAVARIVGRGRRGRRELPAARRDRERQDRGVPAGVRGGARAGPRRDRARAGDRAGAADGRPRPGAVRRPRRDPPFGADRRRAARRARADRERRGADRRRRPLGRLRAGARARPDRASTRSTTPRTSRTPTPATTPAPSPSSAPPWRAPSPSSAPRRRGPRAGRRWSASSLGGRIGADLPPVRVVDLRREAGYPLSAPLLAELRAVAERRGKAILLLNRRGIAPALHCRACGTTIRCPNCDVALVLHGDSELRCHHCGFAQERADGVPGVRVARPRAARRGDAEARAGARAGAPRPGADPPRRRRGLASPRRWPRCCGGSPTTPGVGAARHADGGQGPPLLGRRAGRRRSTPTRGSALPDFRAEERTFQLITQLAGRSGRDAPGQVLVQTFQPDARPIVHAARHDVERLPRRGARAPPRARLPAVQAPRADRRQRAASSTTSLQALERAEGRASAGVELLGPAPLPRLRNRHRAQLVAKTDVAAGARLAGGAAARRPRRPRCGRPGLTAVVDVDPQSV